MGVGRLGVTARPLNSVRILRRLGIFAPVQPTDLVTTQPLPFCPSLSSWGGSGGSLPVPRR
jgi:hypothetical protein